MATLKSIPAMLERYQKKVQSRANEVSKEVARTVFKHLTERTPWDTTQAISNWQVGLGFPNAPERGPIVDSNYEASSHQAFVIGNSKIKLKKIGEPIYISNNLDYIRALDTGRSPQNENFVAAAIEEGKATLAELVK